MGPWFYLVSDEKLAALPFENEAFDHLMADLKFLASHVSIEAFFPCFVGLPFL